MGYLMLVLATQARAVMIFRPLIFKITTQFISMLKWRIVQEVLALVFRLDPKMCYRRVSALFPLDTRLTRALSRDLLKPQVTLFREVQQSGLLYLSEQTEEFL